MAFSTMLKHKKSNHKLHHFILFLKSQTKTHEGSSWAPFQLTRQRPIVNLQRQPQWDSFSSLQLYFSLFLDLAFSCLCWIWICWGFITVVCFLFLWQIFWGFYVLCYSFFFLSCWGFLLCVNYGEKSWTVH